MRWAFSLFVTPTLPTERSNGHQRATSAILSRGTTSSRAMLASPPPSAGESYTSSRYTLRSRSSTTSTLSYTPSQAKLLVQLEDTERRRAERGTTRAAMRDWSATGRLRPTSAPAHRRSSPSRTRVAGPLCGPLALHPAGAVEFTTLTPAAKCGSKLPALGAWPADWPMAGAQKPHRLSSRRR